MKGLRSVRGVGIPCWAVVAVVLSAPVVALAGTVYTWDGDYVLSKNDHDWGQKKNWNPENQGQPTTGDTAIFNDTAPASTRSVTLGTSYATDVYVNGTGSWTWTGGTLNLNGTLYYGSTGDSLFDGVLDATASLVIMPGAGTLTFTNDNTCSGTTTVNGGKLHVQNTGNMRNSDVTVQNGGKIVGKGHLKSLTVERGGITSPGESPGTMSVNDETWAAGGIYLWEINDVDASAGQNPGWDFKDISNTLAITATSTPGDRFVIDITSLMLDDQAGDVHDFVAGQAYSWTIATAAGGITGFASDKFDLQASAFTNDLGEGFFEIGLSGDSKSIVLSYVPEPSAALLVAIGAMGLLWRRRRRLA